MSQQELFADELPPSLGVQTLKRPPLRSFDGEWGAWLGYVLEVETERALLSWGRREAPMCWVPSVAALVWLPGLKGRELELCPTDIDGDASEIFELWADRPVKSYRTFEFKGDGEAAIWQGFGPARRIDYFSDKQNQRAEYTHELGPSVRLYRYGAGRRWCWVLQGGRLRVSEKGLEG